MNRIKYAVVILGLGLFMTSALLANSEQSIKSNPGVICESYIPDLTKLSPEALIDATKLLKNFNPYDLDRCGKKMLLIHDIESVDGMPQSMEGWNAIGRPIINRAVALSLKGDDRLIAAVPLALSTHNFPESDEDCMILNRLFEKHPIIYFKIEVFVSDIESRCRTIDTPYLGVDIDLEESIFDILMVDKKSESDRDYESDESELHASYKQNCQVWTELYNKIHSLLKTIKDKKIAGIARKNLDYTDEQKKMFCIKLESLAIMREKFHFQGEVGRLGDAIVKVSSHLSSKNKKISYGVKNLFDKNLATAWVEGATGFGIGQTIDFQLSVNKSGDYDYSKLSIVTGYVKNKKTWKDNGRVKDILLEVGYPGGSISKTVQLKDTPDVQYIELTPTSLKNFDYIKMTIKDVYPGEEHYDIAISEIGLVGQKT